MSRRTTTAKDATIADDARIQNVTESAAFARLLGKFREHDAALTRISRANQRGRALALCAEHRWDPTAAIAALDAEIGAITAQITAAKAARAQANDRLARLNEAAAPTRSRLMAELSGAETELAVAIQKAAAIDDERFRAIVTLTNAGLDPDEAAQRARPPAAELAEQRELAEALPARIAALQADMKNWVVLVSEPA